MIKGNISPMIHLKPLVSPMGQKESHQWVDTIIGLNSSLPIIALYICTVVLVSWCVESTFPAVDCGRGHVNSFGQWGIDRCFVVKAFKMSFFCIPVLNRGNVLQLSRGLRKMRNTGVGKSRFRVVIQKIIIQELMNSTERINRVPRSHGCNPLCACPWTSGRCALGRRRCTAGRQPSPAQVSQTPFSLQMCRPERNALFLISQFSDGLLRSIFMAIANWYIHSLSPIN